MIYIFSVHYKQLFYDGAARTVVSCNHFTKCVETVAGCSAFPVNIADGASDGPMVGYREDKTRTRRSSPTVLEVRSSPTVLEVREALMLVPAVSRSASHEGANRLA